MARLRKPNGHLDPDGAYEDLGLPNPFPRGISHGDTDNEIELNGHWLNHEHKRPGEPLSEGQRHTLDAKVQDGRTCYIIWGDPPPGTNNIYFIQRYPNGPKRPATWQMLHEIECAWAAWAQSQPRPAPRPNLFTESVAALPVERVAAQQGNEARGTLSLFDRHEAGVCPESCYICRTGAA